MLRRVLGEPLVHFLALALLIFAVDAALDRSPAESPEGIVVTGAKIEQLAAIFARTWQRPPTPAELKGLIDEHVKDEILVREAVALGLDTDDTVIRRRLRLKMEFLGDAAADQVTPSDADLEAFLKANPARFAVDPSIAFEQIYLSPERHGDRLDEEAAAVLAVLQDGAGDPATLGDPSLLPAALPPTGVRSIGQMFGTEFVQALHEAPPSRWIGPLASPFGLHLVRIQERDEGRLPPLAEIRDVVAREWANEHRQQQEERRFAELLERYEVTIEGASGLAPTP